MSDLKDNNISFSAEDMGDAHISSTAETPMREDAFNMADEEKIEVIREHFEKIMDTLGLDLTDDSLKGTPLRVAKMFVKETGASRR